VELWTAADSIERGGLRRRWPDADEDEIVFRLAARRFGLDLARRAYGRS
jgi:hypothetical protein